MKTKMFSIGDILCITTGRLVSSRGIEGIYDILGFMMDETLWTHQLPDASKICKPLLLEQFPWLDSPEVDFAVGELAEMLERTEDKDTQNLVDGWVAKLTSKLIPDLNFPYKLVVQNHIKKGK